MRTLLSPLAIAAACWAPFLEAQFAFERREGEMAIALDGKPLAVYVWDDPATPRPYFKDVRAPDGTRVTRSHPPGPGDLSDHPDYHPGIWWGFGDIGGNDYWRLKARVEGGDFVSGPTGGRDRAHFAVRNRYMAEGSPDRVFVEQLAHYTLLRRPHGTLLLAECRFQRDGGGFWMGDQEEMGLAVRLASGLAASRNPRSRMVNAQGLSDIPSLRTTPSPWVRYGGPLEGRHAGMILFSDPDSFRLPWWHAVDTGLLVANAFGRNELSGRGKLSQSWWVPLGETLRLRYGVLAYSVPDPSQLDAARAYQDFVEALESVRWEEDPEKEAAALPRVPEGFRAEVFASEPLVFKPAALAFDDQGRLFVGQGPQYPHHHETFPADSVHLLLDRDGDGRADEAREFAGGLNSVQGLAWKGEWLYIANAPELTAARDLDGDGRADEYVVVYTDLGNREHALHGLVWGPDGKLYMSKGNSKGHNQPERFGRVAPRPFRELWDVEHPPGAPDFYPPRSYARDAYRRTYHDSNDDWGREGGILRADPMGSGLEIVARGLRNPWDIAMDGGFNWLGTDNDQNQGDKAIAPFFGAHFGWGHPYSSHWTGRGHLPTVPMSGPVFHGSGAGIVYHDHPSFPSRYRGIFLINDWTRGTLVFRPSWEGSLMAPEGGRLELFAGSGQAPYRPTDIEFGPRGRLYSCGWGRDYHYEPGREGSWIYRFSPVGPGERAPERDRSRPRVQWTDGELIDDLGTDALPVWRVAAQDELLRRGASAAGSLKEALEGGSLDEGEATWALWTLGRIEPPDPRTAAWIEERTARPGAPLGQRIQGLRILAHRIREGMDPGPLPLLARKALADPHPRIRLEAVLALGQARDTAHLEALIRWLPHETDRLAFYAAWGVLRDRTTVGRRKELLRHGEAAVRLAALLGLLEGHHLSLEEALERVGQDPDPRILQVLLSWSQNPEPPAPMPNRQSRIEQESSIPLSGILERLEGLSDPRLRPAYLSLLARHPIRGPDEWEALLGFYRSLSREEEKALVLPGLCRRPGAIPLIWEALGGGEQWRRAAGEGLSRLLAGGRSTPEEAAERLLELVARDPLSGSAGEALGAMAGFRFAPGWAPSGNWDALLRDQFEASPDAGRRNAALRLAARMDPERLRASEPLLGLVRDLARKPDPRLMPAILALADRMEVEVVPDPEGRATLEGVLALLPGADPEEGRILFGSSQAGCTLCHSVEGRGSRLGPDLSGVGLRSDPAALAASILDPSASVAEGYRLQRIETAARTLAGAVLEESDLRLSIFDAEGRTWQVAQKDVIGRTRLEESAMPASYPLLGDRAVADLVAFLAACRHPDPAGL